MNPVLISDISKQLQRVSNLFHKYMRLSDDNNRMTEFGGIEQIKE